MTKRRTRDEIKLEILRVLSENTDGLRATTIANAVGVNFVPGREILSEMETVDKTIIRGTDKLYVIRENGRMALKRAAMGSSDIVRIIDLAREITKESPTALSTVTIDHEDGGYEREVWVCLYCGKQHPEHMDSCKLIELRRLVSK